MHLNCHPCGRHTLLTIVSSSLILHCLRCAHRLILTYHLGLYSTHFAAHHIRCSWRVVMVPPRTRLSLSKERFPAFLTNLKSQPYHDPSSSSRGHTYGPCPWTVPVDILTCNANYPYRLRSIAWNPLGTLVATGSSDKTLRVCT